MGLTSSMRITATAAVAVMLGGLAAILHGVLRDNLASAVGGLSLTLTALTAVALILIHRWITDTSDERRGLAALQRQAQEQKSVYVAAQAALEVEQGRLAQDMATERYNLAVRLKAEREAMAREFDERRAALAAETMETTFLMLRNGKFETEAPAPGNLIPFPQQGHPEQAPQHERSREHGVVGP